ncbi:MAG: MotA/TolQ/ExbB proton channel family protein [Luteolibacter sp.]
MNLPTPAEQKQKFWGKMIWISAISLALSVCAFFILPVIGMVNAFSTLKTAGSADPAALAGDISTAIYGSLIAIPFAAISLILFVIAILRHKKLSNPAERGL